MPSSPDPAAAVWVVADTTADQRITLTVTGELTFTTADAARAQLTVLIDRCPAPEIRMDLRDLDFCDVAGLRVLLQLAARASAAGRPIRVVAASAELDWLLTFTETAPSLGYQPTNDSPPGVA